MSERAPILGKKPAPRRELLSFCHLPAPSSSPGAGKMATKEPLLLDVHTFPRHHAKSLNDPRQEEEPDLLQQRLRLPRIVKRSDGRSTIRHSLSPQSYLIYVQDFFTSIINSRWYAIIPFFFACYVLSWLFFGGLWSIVAYSYDATSNITCVYHLNDYKSAFLFSVETQTTLGFGYRYPSSACGAGILLLVVQSVAGLILDSFLLGLMFAKITRPRNRRKTIFFSDRAVIYTRRMVRVFVENRDQLVEKAVQQRVLEFRIADVRRSQVVEGHVRLQLYWYREASSGAGGRELRQYDLDVGYDTGRDRVFLLTPVTVTHHITEDSPLHSLTPETLSSSHLELVVILEGIVEATGLTAQILWSYTQDEIVFDHSFQPVTCCNETSKEWIVDFSKLSTLQIHRNPQ